jgi:hypothetical protein
LTHFDGKTPGVVSQIRHLWQSTRYIGLIERDRTSTLMTRRWIIGLLLILHGFLHLFWFLTSWDLIDVPGISRTPTILDDDIPIGVIRDLGALWLLGLVAFSIAGYGAIVNYRWWKGVAFGSAIVSFIVTIFWIHEAWPGLFFNGIIVTLIARSWYQTEHNNRLSESARASK